MQPELKNLRIDRSQKSVDEPSPWAVRWILIGVGLLILLGAGRFIYGKLTAATDVDIVRVHAATPLAGGEGNVIAKAKADVDQARVDQQNAHVTLTRTSDLVRQGVLSKQALDDAQARYDGAAAKVASLDRAYELVRLGPRQEEIDALRAQVNQAQGTLDYAQVQLDNTIIRAPIDGTILERNVEKGEFVTTGFVGDKGAKGYVVSIANLHELDVELDINQNDFAKLGPT